MSRTEASTPHQASTLPIVFQKRIQFLVLFSLIFISSFETSLPPIEQARDDLT
jgi:hypothetical protein